MRDGLFLIVFVFATLMFSTSVYACTCPGVNPDLYPPDIAKSKSYYRNEFQGAAFTGTVITSREAARMKKAGEKLQELTVEVDRYWLGVKRRTMTIYAPKDLTGCWTPFREKEKYFFIPAVEDGILYVGVCTYATYNRKADGNYVEFMTGMFGPGKTFRPRSIK